jgi:hypothetical protein
MDFRKQIKPPKIFKDKVGSRKMEFFSKSSINYIGNSETTVIGPRLPPTIKTVPI